MRSDPADGQSGCLEDAVDDTHDAVPDFDEGGFVRSTPDQTLGTVEFSIRQPCLGAVHAPVERLEDAHDCLGRDDLRLTEHHFVVGVEQSDGDLVCVRAVVVPNDDALVADGRLLGSGGGDSFGSVLSPEVGLPISATTVSETETCSQRVGGCVGDVGGRLPGDVTERQRAGGTQS